MEPLFLIISLVFVSALVFYPFFYTNQIKNFSSRQFSISKIIVGAIFGITIIVLYAFWIDKSNMILLNHYGYNFDFMNEIEKFIDVTDDNIERVKELEMSIMGIGWTLKAIFLSIIYLPYFLIIYFFKKKKQHLH